MSNKNKGFSFFATLGIAALSAGAALLFAPKSGKELREELKTEAEKLAAEGEIKARHLAEDVRSSVEEVRREHVQQNEVHVTEETPKSATVKQETVVTESGEITEIERPSGNVTEKVYGSQDDFTIPIDRIDQALADNGFVDEDDVK